LLVILVVIYLFFLFFVPIQQGTHWIGVSRPKVEPTTSSNPTFSCLPYTLELQYTNVAKHCCTLVKCAGAADPICSQKSCGTCGASGHCGKP
jgi:hypothetical protein